MTSKNKEFIEKIKLLYKDLLHFDTFTGPHNLKNNIEVNIDFENDILNNNIPNINMTDDERKYIFNKLLNGKHTCKVTGRVP